LLQAGLQIDLDAALLEDLDGGGDSSSEMRTLGFAMG
jgi:hypothetical protein